MATKLYVGNLPFNTSEEELKLAFAQCGTVSEVSIITDRETGRSRGFGFVRMADDTGFAAAIQRWNGSSFGGRDLVVNEAQDKPRGGGGGGGGQRRQFSPPPDHDRKGDGRRGGSRRGGRDRDYG